ncbi:LPS assembly lipoprotein LptE [Marinobacter sp.]|uniref:LPS-assembly lipoprotein LptE n=1 Tax=Marinobacter sp. TaxID=50741 RepID=UPI00384C46F1
MAFSRLLLVPCLLALSLTGCGFQLRGQAQISDALEPIALQCNERMPQELCRTVKNQLELRDIQLAEPEDAAHVLRLENFREERRASAITQQASAAEFDLRQSLSMSVITSDSLPLIADTQLSTRDTYRYDETNVLAKRREEQEIRSGLYQRLAEQIIFRLAPLTGERIESLRSAAAAAAETEADRDETP